MVKEKREERNQKETVLAKRPVFRGDISSEIKQSSPGAKKPQFQKEGIPAIPGGMVSGSFGGLKKDKGHVLGQ